MSRTLEETTFVRAEVPNVLNVLEQNRNQCFNDLLDSGYWQLRIVEDH